MGRGARQHRRHGHLADVHALDHLDDLANLANLANLEAIRDHDQARRRADDHAAHSREDTGHGADGTRPGHRPRLGGVTGCGNPRPTQVMLTFDDGGPQAPALLAILDRYGLKARWFPTGEWAGAHASFIAQLNADGQMLGNHTYSHPQMFKALGTDELNRQITLGYHPSTILRFPYGASDAVSRELVRSAGYAICGWNIDTNDWRGNDAATITQIVTGQARQGSVVLMHMTFQADVDALPTIITTLRSRGLI